MERLGLIFAVLLILLARPAAGDVYEVSGVCSSPCFIAWTPSFGDPDGYDVTYSFADAWHFLFEVAEPIAPVNEIMLGISPAPVRYRVRAFKEGFDHSPWSEPSELLTSKSPRPRQL